MKRLLSLLLLLPFVCPGQTTGSATFYADYYVGRPMANGVAYDHHKLTCASWDYPFGTRLLVEYKDRSVVVVVTDRGPAKWTGNKIDLSLSAFRRLENPRVGKIRVRITRL